MAISADLRTVQWLCLGGMATFHALCTLIASALREVSNARLEERLSSDAEISLYNRLLQDDHETVADLSTLRGVTLALSGVLLGWIYFGAEGTAINGLKAVFGALGFVLFAHALPRSVGDYFAEGIVIKVMPGVWRLLWLCRPITVPYRWAVLVVHRIIGTSLEEDAAEEADDEIRSAAIEAVRDGVLEESALNMIERVIDFRDVEVTEVMTPRIELNALEIGASFSDAIELLLEHGHSRLPVYEGSIDKIVGIVHIKDILDRLHQDGDSASLSIDEIIRKPLFVPESKRVRDLFGEIKNSKIHIAIVVDEYGGTAGLVTVNDIISEIFGEFDDEHDSPERKSIERLNDKTFSVDGKVHIDELNENLGIDIPEDDDYDTVSGYLSAHLGKIPSIGDKHQHNDYTFRVLEGDERRVDRVEIRLYD